MGNRSIPDACRAEPFANDRAPTASISWRLPDAAPSPLRTTERRPRRSRGGCLLPRRALRERPSADRILAAAETLFANKGYGEVSLRQLIAASGVSTTAFYARFDSKAAVLDTLTERLFAELQLEAAMTLRNVKDFASGIERGVDVLVARFGPRKALVRLIVAESGSLVPMLSTRRKSYATLAGFLGHYFKLLSDRGRISVADPQARGRQPGTGRGAGRPARATRLLDRTVAPPPHLCDWTGPILP